MNLQFVNPRNQQYSNTNAPSRNSFKMFSRKIYPPASNSQINQGPTPQPTSAPQNDPKKIKWGPPTWYLFHTLAEKVNEKSFAYIKNDLINNIISICKNLPCPKCATHASEYMSKVNVNSIRTKSDLKNMLFIFHNEVNSRIGTPQFSYEELNDKYSRSITINIIQTFFVFFQDKSFNVSSITNNMHRGRLIESLKNWFLQNIQHFEN
jgi:hypothetical protein